MVHSPGPSKRGNRLVVTLKEAGPYHFRRATMNDLDLLMTWQFHNHVSTWWDSDEPFDLEELSDPKVSRWIVSFEDRPTCCLAFRQTLRVRSVHLLSW